MRPRKDVDVGKLLKLYEKYGNTRKVGVMLGVSETTVRRRLEELGVKRRRWQGVEIDAEKRS